MVGGTNPRRKWETERMSMDKSLKRTSQLVRQRCVLTRPERISRLMAEDRWTEGMRPVGLPKVKVIRALLKKAKKAKEEAAPGPKEPTLPRRPPKEPPQPLARAPPQPLARAPQQRPSPARAPRRAASRPGSDVRLPSGQ